VWTGSPNLTKSIFRNDESLLRIADEHVYNEYEGAFEILWEKAVPMTPQSLNWCMLTTLKGKRYSKWDSNKFKRSGKPKTKEDYAREKMMFKGVKGMLPHL
jgi:hypothetical protein